MNHDTYKKLKRKNKTQLEAWVNWFGFFNYMSGIKDSDAAIYRHLIDDFGFTDEQIAKLHYSCQNLADNLRLLLYQHILLLVAVESQTEVGTSFLENLQ